MVLTVTLNPLLEKKLFFKNLTKHNRAYNQKYLAGGKGINVSRQLNHLGIKNHSLIFLGGSNGKKLRAVLESENISFSAVTSKDETREATLVYDESAGKLKTYFGVNSIITENEIENFINKMEKAIINSSIVVFSGSLPNKLCSIIIEKGLELCNKYDKISILDSYGEMLSKQINCSPTILHNNIEEISNSLKMKLANEKEIRNLLTYLYQKGIKLAFLTSGNKNTYASKYDFHYKINNPKVIEIDSTGSGDAFVSGIVYGLEKSLVFDEFTKLASALGAVNATKNTTCAVDYNEAENLISQISISEIGKKLKLINDSPTI